MKKIILFIILLFPGFVFADYNITNYKVDINVLDNGDVDIVEIIEMNGNYNGFERKINYKDNYDNYYGSRGLVTTPNFYSAEDIELNEIRAVNFSLEPIKALNNSFLFSKVSKASKGEYGVYTINKNYFGETYKIYNPSKLNKDFYISYKLKNVVLNHNDLNELALNIFSKMEENIDNLEIDIHVPTNKKLLDVWTHGDVKATKKIIDKQNLSIVLTSLASDTYFDFRMIFDISAITDFNKETSILAYNKIIEIEDKLSKSTKDKDENIKKEAYELVKKANDSYSLEDYNEAYSYVSKLREDDFKIELLVKLMNIEQKVERKNILTKVILTSFLALWIFGLLIFIYQAHKNDNSNNEYKSANLKKIPYDYSLSTIGYLFKRKVTNNELIASILNLIAKKNISFDKLKNSSDYKFVRISNENLTGSEERIMKLLFDNGNQVTLTSLNKKSTKNYEDFLNKYSNWLNSAIVEATSEEFYDENIINKIISVSYCIVGIILGAFLIDLPTFFNSVFVIVLALIFGAYFILYYRKTKKGILHYSKWKSFKKHIINDQKDFLPYAVLFKINKIALKSNDYKIIKKFIDSSISIAYNYKK